MKKILVLPLLLLSVLALTGCGYTVTIGAPQPTPTYTPGELTKIAQEAAKQIN